MKHSNIKSNRHLHDKKHLNQIGVKRFAQNLKRAYFRQEPKPTDSPRRYHNKPYLPHFQLSIPNWKSPNSHPPSSASPFVPHFPLNQRLPPNINQQQRPPQDPAIYSNRLRPPTKLAMKIFDGIVSPILLYNSEVWEGFSKWDKTLIERSHSKFCKTYLGANKKASDIASRGELGKFPLVVAILYKPN